MRHTLSNSQATARPLARWLFVLFLCIYLLCARGRNTSSDAESMQCVTRAIVERHSFSIPPESPSAIEGKDGLFYSKYGIGKSLANVPFYLVGRVAARFVRRLPDDWATGFAISMLNPILGALTCATLFRFCLMSGFTARRCVFLTLVYGLCTIAFPSSKDDMSEPLAVFAVTAAAYCAAQYRATPTTRLAFACAISLGAAVATRHVLAIVVPMFGAYLFVPARPPGSGDACRRPERIRELATFLLVLATIGVLLATYNWVRFGSVLETGYDKNGEGASNGFSLRPLTFVPHVLGLLISPGRGLLVYSPIFALAPLGVCRAFRSRPLDTTLAFTAFTSFVLLHGAFRSWEGGWGWGPRFLLPILPLLMPILGYSLDLPWTRLPWGRRVIAALVALSFVIQLSAVLVSPARYYHQMNVELEEGRAHDLIWSVSAAQPVRQWQHVAIVFRQRSASRQSLIVGASHTATSEREYLRTAASINVPDFWFVYAALARLPWPLIGGPLCLLLAGLALALRILALKLRAYPVQVAVQDPAAERAIAIAATLSGPMNGEQVANETEIKMRSPHAPQAV